MVTTTDSAEALLMTAMVQRALGFRERFAQDFANRLANAMMGEGG